MPTMPVTPDTSSIADAARFFLTQPGPMAMVILNDEADYSHAVTARGIGVDIDVELRSRFILV